MKYIFLFASILFLMSCVSFTKHLSNDFIYSEITKGDPYYLPENKLNLCAISLYNRQTRSKHIHMKFDDDDYEKEVIASLTLGTNKTTRVDIGCQHLGRKVAIFFPLKRDINKTTFILEKNIFVYFDRYIDLVNKLGSALVGVHSGGLLIDFYRTSITNGSKIKRRPSLIDICTENNCGSSENFEKKLKESWKNGKKEVLEILKKN